MNGIVNEITWKDLDHDVLVGHSYGGPVITGVAERVGERIASIVYLDAFIPADGQSFADVAPGLDLSSPMIAAPPTTKEDCLSEADRTWVDKKATPQPTATFTEKLHVSGAFQRVPRKTFIRATAWEGPFDAAVATARSDPSWMVYEIASGHDVSINKPDELAAILEACARS